MKPPSDPLQTNKLIIFAAIALSLQVITPVNAETMATIEDPDGYTNVRGEEDRIIAKVKTGEKFLAWEPRPGSTQWEVWLPSGIRGFMHRSRIRPLAGEPLMKLSFPDKKKEWQGWVGKSEEDSEIDQHARSQGINYNETLLRGAEGDVKALGRFFSLSRSVDGAAAESHFSLMWELFHVVGDDKFARFLSSQSRRARQDIADDMMNERTTWPITDSRGYVRRHFPKTFALLGDA